MNNATIHQILIESGWLDNLNCDGCVHTNVNDLRQYILENLADPNGESGVLLLTEECFDSENLYDPYRTLNDMYNLAVGDVDEQAFMNAFKDAYETPEALFDDANRFLASQGVDKAFYILPQVDQMVFYVYKPIAVYQKALELGLPLDVVYNEFWEDDEYE